jgi:hypothetical protein
LALARLTGQAGQVYTHRARVGEVCWSGCAESVPGEAGPLLQRALSWFEAVLYGIVAVLLVVAAILVLVGTGEAIIDCRRPADLIVTAEFEQSQTLDELNNLLLELGLLGVLVPSLAAAIFLVRPSSRREAGQPPPWKLRPLTTEGDRARQRCRPADVPAVTVVRISSVTAPLRRC